MREGERGGCARREEFPALDILFRSGGRRRLLLQAAQQGRPLHADQPLQVHQQPVVDLAVARRGTGDLDDGRLVAAEVERVHKDLRGERLRLGAGARHQRPRIAGAARADGALAGAQDVEPVRGVLPDAVRASSVSNLQGKR